MKETHVKMSLRQAISVYNTIWTCWVDMDDIYSSVDEPQIPLLPDHASHLSIAVHSSVYHSDMARFIHNFTFQD